MGRAALSDLAIEEHEQGLILPVRASAGAKRNTVGGTHQGMLRVSVTQSPEKGKANQAMTQLLAKKLGVAQAAVLLVSGQTHRQKRFLIVGKTRKQLQELAG